MTTRRAQCTCGQLSASCSGEPTVVAVCHCLACQRRSGSAFSFNAWFEKADVATAGEAREFVRVGDEGGRITFSFCPTCGVTVFYRNDQFPGAVGVAAGAFADLDVPPPTVSVYHDSRGYPWLEITAEPLQKRG